MNRIVAATAIAVGLSSGPAHAVCSLADIGGTWEFYGDLYSATSQFASYALRCTLHIDGADGTVATASACESSPVNGAGTFRGTVLYGQFSMMDPDNCTFNLRFGTDAGRVSIPVEAIHATLSPSKEIMAGMLGERLSRGRGGGTIFTMVKIR